MAADAERQQREATLAAELERQRIATEQRQREAERKAEEERQKVAADARRKADDETMIVARDLVIEAQERLYELNYNPGLADGTVSRMTEQAIREFEERLGLVASGRLTQGLLRHLRSAGGLKPWGAIVFSEETQKWGMSWNHETRKAAVAAARASCGTSPSTCATSVTFFGGECAAFAYSDTRWSLVARENSSKAQTAALEQCQKQATLCKIVAAACAAGQERPMSKQ